MTKNAMIKHRKNYTAINNSLLQDKNISWRAKGLLCEILSHADDEEFTTDDMLDNCKETDIESVLVELEIADYILRDDKNTINVFDEPNQNNEM